MSLTLPSPDTGNVSHTRGHDPRTSTLHPIPRKTSNQSSQASASSSQRTLSSSTSHTKSINLHDFKCVAFIGKGSFGTVHCIEHKPSGLRAALKMMKKYPNVWPGYFEDLPEDVREKEKIRIRKITWTNIVNESVALQKLHGQKHVLQLHAAFQDADNFYLLTDFYPGRDVEFLLTCQEDGVFDFETVQFYLADILLGLKAIHDQAIFHGDVKLKNILLGADGHVVIADFGLTHIFQGGKGPAQRSVEVHIREFEGGTLDYLAPEVLKTQCRTAGESYGYPADIWALGIVAYEMLVGKHPFCDIIDEDDLYSYVDETGVQFKVEDVQEYDLNFQSIDFVRNACRRDQYERPTAEQLMATAMFDGFDWAAHMAGMTEAPGIPPEDFFPESKDKHPPVEIFSTDFVQMTEDNTLDFNYRSPDFFERFVSSANSPILSVEDTAEMDEKDGDITITASYSEPLLLDSPPPSPVLPSPPPPSPREPTPEPETTLGSLAIATPAEKYDAQPEGLFSKVKDLTSSVWGPVTHIAKSCEQSVTMESTKDITLGPSPSEPESIFSASSSSSRLPPPCFVYGISRDMIPSLGHSIWSPRIPAIASTAITAHSYNTLTKSLPTVQATARPNCGLSRNIIPGLSSSIWSPRLPATEFKIPCTPITFLAPSKLSESKPQFPATSSYSALELAITSALTRCCQEVPSFPSAPSMSSPTPNAQQYLRNVFTLFVKTLVLDGRRWFQQQRPRFI
ncbi:kinase-like domain-containing protein [Abortiporus biennis]|nr:kinase-like domain-containing protein [Abortiporus biennis]